MTALLHFLTYQFSQVSTHVFIQDKLIPYTKIIIFSIFVDEFRQFLENELIDTSMSVSLQEASRLNWWTCLEEGCEKLWPLSTTGDGNCLLHAASLGKNLLCFVFSLCDNVCILLSLFMLCYLFSFF